MAVPPQRARRAAVLCLGLVLLALTALSVAGAISTRQSAQTVVRATAMAKTYDRAHDAVAAEESLERKYRVEPGADVRARHRQAGRDLNTALGEILTTGGPTDFNLASRVHAAHDRYQAAVARMFVAVDAGDVATTLRIDETEADPTFTEMSDLVQAATDQHAAAAATAVVRLHRIEGLVLLSTVVGFTVGLCLLAACMAAAIGYERTLLARAQASQYEALHDSLTDLPNRTLFSDRLSQALLQTQRKGGNVAVMLLDLDRFKEVNDTLGHQYGDELLRQFAVRVRDVLRANDTVARLSGDEFAVLLPDADEQDATALAGRVIDAVHRSFTLSDVTVDVEVSVGVAVAPAHGDTADTVLRCADVAMYAAKDSKTGLVTYRPEMHTEDSSRLLLLGDLRRALDATDQLVLHYQPKVSLEFGDVRGVEALIRWHHPTRGMVSPADFIPIAETTGLINRLTEYVLRAAIAQAREWCDEEVPVSIAVNLSPRCLLDPELVGQVTGLLDEFGLPAHLLRLEVTETAVMANPALAMMSLTELHERGIRLSIDDFGTGYSSMSYLKRLPVDELKVDRSFVLNMTGDDSDAVLVRSAIDLGHNLNLTVVAEGVEGDEHVAALQGLGCDVAQGFHYARPMPPEDLTLWMKVRRFTHPGPTDEPDRPAFAGDRPYQDDSGPQQQERMPSAVYQGAAG